MITRTECRACKAGMTDILSLGDIVPVDFIRPGEDVRPAAPLTLAKCDDCGLVQLRDMLEPDSLFRQYWYLSGLNPTMVSALRDVANAVSARIDLAAGDTIIDIGANDGTLLDLFDDDLFKIGFDPARNLAERARAACNLFVNDYFPSAIDLPTAKVITSIAMFYDLDDPHTFLDEIAHTLHADGMWVMQMTDLVRMLRTNAFDNICHEHLCYYSLAIFKKMVEQHGLEVFDVEFNDVNGASVRTFVGFPGVHPVRPTVARALLDEANYLEQGGLERFRERTMAAKDKIVTFVRRERAEGKTIHAMGASTKGNTLLQFFGLTRDDIEVAAEVSPAKFGLVMAGSGVPIVSQEQSLAAKPDYYLVLPWHFLDFLLAKHTEYLQAGGALVSPLPIPAQYTMERSTSGYVTVERRLGPTHG